MTKVYLGNPPEHIRQWIIAHSEPIKPKMTPLCFTAEEANSTVKLQKQGSDAIEGFNGLEYKLNDGNWTSYDIDSTITLENVGNKVYMRAVAAGNSRMGTDDRNYHQFIMTGRIAASGNINTLLNPDPNADVGLEGKGFCYTNMFYKCKALTQAPELPATTLANNCYSNMFAICSSLTQAPELPATTLADFCYNGIFYRCSSLTQAPELPATTLTKGCYYYMFSYCTSLTQAPELLATKLARNCYFYMFENCSQFSEVHMKQEMNGVYSTSTHGNTTKTVVYDLA